jgi:iron complex outermembrane recepter protein
MRLSRLNTKASVLALALAALPGVAQAQTAADAQDDTASAPDAGGSGAGEGEIVVTGSRIARSPEFAFPNPVQSFSAESLEQSGQTNLTDFLTESPALLGSTTSQDTAGSNAGFQEAGLNLLNLRNLGSDRTLVLVDGRRHVAGYPGVASVDINTIPADLIERVDVLTGGASAIYGADGVSGVVNFVMKRNFEGLSARGQAGISSRGDAGNRFFSVVAGENFADDRANLTLAYEFDQSDRFNQQRRLNYGLTGPSRILTRNQADIPDDPNIPDNVLQTNLRWADSSMDGAVDLGSVVGGVFVPGELDGIPDYTGSGTVYDRGQIVRGTAFTIGGSSTPREIYYGDYTPFNRRHIGNAMASFEFSPALRLFAEGKYVATKAYTQSQPTYDFFTYMAPDNAFLQERFGALADGGALISRDNFDFGVRGDTSKRETIRTVLGADGRFGSNFRYELSYVYGQSKATTLSQDDRYSDRYYAALDTVVNPANGQVTCRINLPGETTIDPNNYDGPAVTFQPGQCVPLNILGNGVASQEALDWVTVDSLTRSKITQHVVSGSVSGDTGSFFELPGGPVGFALGAEYRREGSASIPSEELQEGLLLDSATILPARGHFDVKEVFGEVNVPILADMPFAQTLSVGGAVRLSDYSTVGSTTTWKVDGVYAPVRDITFRATYSEAVRAPNISELFAGQSGSFEFIGDPCDTLNIAEGTQYRAANCATLLGAYGIDPATFNPNDDPTSPDNSSIQGLSGGNPNLQEETAKTWTAGVVLRPRFIPGLTVAFDWYDIKLKDAISTATAEEIAELCVDQPSLDNVFCDAITRDPTTGYVSTFVVGPQNVASFDTSGLDVNFNYRFTPSEKIGTFNLRVVGNYLDQLQYIPTVGAEIDNDRSEPYAPKFSASADLTWSKGPLTLNYGINWLDNTRRYTTEELAANPDKSDPRYFWYKEKWDHQFQARYNVDDRFSIYGGVNNLFDQKPSVGASGFPISAVGRFFYVGARIGLADLF